MDPHMYCMCIITVDIRHSLDRIHVNREDKFKHTWTSTIAGQCQRWQQWCCVICFSSRCKLGQHKMMQSE